MSTLKKYLFLLGTVLAISGFVACNDDNDEVDPYAEKNAMLEPAVIQYVDNTVIATYRSLADGAIELYETVAKLRDDKSQTTLAAAAQYWLQSRKYWELSEAFLFGPAKDFGIDPHIDSWPLSEPAFNAAIADADLIASMDSEDGALRVVEKLHFSLLGFHGIEYIFFADGKVKDIASITDAQLVYTKAVAGDLRNQCIRLEAAWAGFDNVSAKKQAIIEENELEIERGGSDLSYGENMKYAGKIGSTYYTFTLVATDILTGCIDISDEVGITKIGTTYNKESLDHIESPYSYNSLTDFEDNIHGIENVYFGGVADNRGASISDYVKYVDPETDTEVRNAIADAIAKIQAIPAPFAKNFTDPKAKEAIDACNTLTSALMKAKSAVDKK
jgi:predicted lipoprotein